MKNACNKNDVATTPLTLSDCRIWAEINYLDSPTCYRECLPWNPLNLASARQSLVLLDDCAGFFNRRAVEWIRAFAAYVTVGPSLVALGRLLVVVHKLK